VLDSVNQKRKLLPLVKSRKLKYFGHISSHRLVKDIVLGTMPGLRRQGGQRKEWSDDLVEWTGKTIPDLVRKAEIAHYRVKASFEILDPPHGYMTI